METTTPVFKTLDALLDFAFASMEPNGNMEQTVDNILVSQGIVSSVIATVRVPSSISRFASAADALVSCLPNAKDMPHTHIFKYMRAGRLVIEQTEKPLSNLPRLHALCVASLEITLRIPDTSPSLVRLQASYDRLRRMLAYEAFRPLIAAVANSPHFDMAVRKLEQIATTFPPRARESFINGVLGHVRHDLLSKQGDGKRPRPLTSDRTPFRSPLL